MSDAASKELEYRAEYERYLHHRIDSEAACHEASQERGPESYDVHLRLCPP